MPDPNSAYLKCPWCREQNNQVLETRGTKESKALRRRRICNACEKIFSTIEIPFDFLKYKLDKNLPDISSLIEYLEKGNG